MDPGIMGGLAAGVAVPIVLRLLAKVVPYQASAESSCDVPFSELSKRYSVWEMFSVLPIVAFTALFTFLWFGLFKLIQALAHSQLPPSKFLLYLPDEFWFLPAFFLGLVSAAVPTHLIYSHLLGDRYAECIHYGNLRAGFDTWRVFRWMAIGIVVISFLAVPLALQCYTRAITGVQRSIRLASWPTQQP